ncbi:SNF1-interacting protein, partial [Rhizophlyctis rosea]
MRRNFDKLQERYDTAVLRFASLSKSKETSALREDAFVLYDIRKLYIKSSLDYTLRILLFRNAVDALIIEQFMGTASSHMDFYDAAGQVFKGLKPALDAVRGRADTERQDIESLESSLRWDKKSIEETAVLRANPGYRIPDPSIASVSSTPSSTTLTPSSPAIHKEGYLSVRTSQKGPLGVPVWVRRYFTLHDDGFGFSTTTRTGKHRGKVMVSSAINVLLCSVKKWRGEERRFCFELYVGRRPPAVLQAESEEDLNAWITAIESAKYYATTLPGGPKAAALVEAHAAEDVIGEEAGIKLFEVKVGGVRRSSKVVR